MNNQIEILKEISTSRAKEIYGDPLPLQAENRLEWELEAIRKGKSAASFLAIHDYLNENAIDLRKAGSKDGAAASLVAFLCGITPLNPLEFKEIVLYPEFFYGMEGEKIPVFELNIAQKCREKLKRELCGCGKYLVIKSCRDLDLIELLMEYTNDPADIKKADITELLNMFVSTRNDFPQMAGIGEFGMKLAVDILKKCSIKTPQDLLKCIALGHGSGAWLQNAQYLIESGSKTIQEVIATREDVFEYLLTKGIDPKTAFETAEAVGRGQVSSGKFPKWKEYRRRFEEQGVESWFLASCENIQFIFLRAHTVSYLMQTLRLAYYKKHYPEIFFEIYMNNSDMGKMPMG